MSEKQYANTELAPASEQRKVKLRLSTGCSGVREISIDAAWNAPGRVANEYEKIYKKVLFRRIKPRKVKKKMLSEWIVFLCILGCLVASLTVQKLENLQFWAVETWKWCVLVLAIFRGMFVANLFMHFIVFVIETNLLLRKKVLIYVHKMKKSVEVFMWLGMVLLTWLLLFNSGIERSKTSTKILDYVMWTLVSGLIGGISMVVENSLV
ncbi:hypothetical protein M0R45_000944 [Rubus argutus]|uniref:Uncharacterized protein n=1 Tax=Rubus argutus TaxID=59490 RepID=A0AAW1VJD1_RUBAR